MMRRFRHDARGVVAVEFAIAAIFMMTAMLNAVDVGSYVWQAMQVENAAQMGVQVALQSCTAAQVPVTQACLGFGTKVVTAVAGTSLGTAITVDAGQPSEAYYCVDGNNKLMLVGALNNKPISCAAAGKAFVAPGDYVVVAVSYTYRPIMVGAGVAAFLQTPIRRSAIMRVQ
jgi:Flp pilus assembly protein TadG